MTPQRLQELRRIFNNFDHCCLSRDEHRKLFREIERLDQLCQQLQFDLTTKQQDHDNFVQWHGERIAELEAQVREEQQAFMKLGDKAVELECEIERLKQH